MERESKLKRSLRFQDREPGQINYEFWNNVERIKEIFLASDVAKKDLPVYYPGAGWDIAIPLAMTNAKNFVFVDYLYITKNQIEPMDKGLPEEIEKIGGEITSITVEGKMGKGGRKIILFNWEEEQRRITLYAEDATEFMASELKDGASFVVIKAPTPASRTNDFNEVPGYIWDPKNMARIYQSIAVGGFFMWEPDVVLPVESFGLSQIIKETEERGYPLYQKIKDEPEIEKLLVFDRKLMHVDSIRFGRWSFSIPTEMSSYIAQLSYIRDFYDIFLSPVKQKEILMGLKNILAPERVDIAPIIRLGLSKDEAIDYFRRTVEEAIRVFPEISSDQKAS